MYSGGPTASTHPMMDHNHHNQQNTMPIKGPDMMSKTPPYIYTDHQQLQRRVTTGPLNKSSDPYNNNNQYNQMAPTGPKPARPNKRKIKSVKTRTKMKKNNSNNNLNNFPSNNPGMFHNRSKTEGQNLPIFGHVNPNKNAHPLYMSTTQQIYTPPAPIANCNEFDHDTQYQWPEQPPKHFKKNLNNIKINANNQYDIVAPVTPCSDVTYPPLSGSVIIHTDEITFENECECATAENNVQTCTPVGAVSPVTEVKVECPLRYMGCNGLTFVGDLNKHYTKQQEKHLDHIITYFDNKFAEFENNYCTKLNDLEKENNFLRNQLKELMDGMNRKDIEQANELEMAMDNSPIMHNYVHSRIPQRNKPTDSKVPASFLMFQKSRSADEKE